MEKCHEKKLARSRHGQCTAVLPKQVLQRILSKEREAITIAAQFGFCDVTRPSPKINTEPGK
jgi:hypothetical protein